MRLNVEMAREFREFKYKTNIPIFSIDTPVLLLLEVPYEYVPLYASTWGHFM